MAPIELYHASVDVMLLLCGAATVLAGVIVLASTRPMEISLRTVSAFLLAGWGATKIALALQPHEPLGFLDLIGPLGVTLWISQAVFRHHHQTMRRFGDWTNVPGLRTNEDPPQ